jgi:exosortase
MPDAPADPPAPPLEFGEAFARFRRWCAAQPGTAALFAASVGVIIYFFGFFKIFSNGSLTAAKWASEAWNAENNQEHSWFILPIAIYLIWHHRADLQAARKQPSNAGLVWVLAGVLAFLVAARALQPRIAIVALPLIIYGAVRFLWGRETGRVFIFPCLFLLFMVPVGGLVQGTVSLQLLVLSAVQALSALIGVKVQAVGTTLNALDGSFNFDIAEGCSGIRSLMAMTTLSALYVHFTQRETWKQWVIFGFSIVFALIGNIGRVFSVVVVARFISERIAGGLYHDYSGFVFFPVAVGAMVGFSKLLNMDWSRVATDALKPETPRPGKKSAGPISYDY